MKTIQKILNGTSTNVGTIKVQEMLPYANHQFFDPFLVFHHGVLVADKNVPTKLQGVGPHPHRGFSPISFIYKGGIHHQDSRGNNHIVYAGGVQWTNAGMGLIHSERVPNDIFEHGGIQEILQVWVNTPAKNKMDIPQYIPIAKDENPTIISKDGLTILRVSSGELNQTKGIIPTFTPVTTVMGEMKTNGNYNFNFSTKENTLFYLLEGEVIINNEQTITAKQLVLFNNDEEEFNIKAIKDSIFFIGSGQPLNEPIAAHGPFVMNTQTEIMQAIRDYQIGKMGILVEE